MGIKAKKCPYEGVIVPTALYGAEAWGMRSAERKKVNKGKVFYGQEPPSGESTTAESGVNYELLAVMH